MPGVVLFNCRRMKLLREAAAAHALGVPAILLFSALPEKRCEGQRRLCEERHRATNGAVVEKGAAVAARHH